MRFLIAFALTFGWYSQAAVLGSMNAVMAASNTYYVSPSGSDSNPGSSAAPFKTFAKAVSVLQAGDTLQVLKGTYYETLTLSKLGTENAPITVVGNNAILNMQGTNPRGIVAKGSHLHISGFEITRATEYGIYVDGNNIVVENNVLHDNVTKNGVGTCGQSTSWGSAVKVKDGTVNTTIRSNTVYDNCGEGITVTRGTTSLIENNTVHDNFSANIYVDNSPFVTVRNNTSYCTGTHLRDGKRPSGIAVGEESYAGWGAQLHDILISGNTITDCRTGISAYESNVGGTLTNVSILNNNIPSGEKRSISLQTLSNKNVLIANNHIFNSVYVLQPAGVTLNGNVIDGSTPASTCSSVYNVDCTFIDVPPTHPYFQEIEALYEGGYTNGCSTTQLKYCPSMIMNRAQLAKFFMTVQMGGSYVPPVNTPHLFMDSWKVNPWAESWANDMYEKRLTSGCSSVPLRYCPDNYVLREQVAKFGLAIKYGSDYIPPPATGAIFADLTDINYWATPWAEQAYLDGLIPNCGVDGSSGKPKFCAHEVVDRGLGAYVIAKAKGLVP